MVTPGALSRHQVIAVDTPLFIYVAEQHPTFGAVANPIFSAIARGEVQALASTLMVAELLVAPYRAGASVQSYLQRLETYAGLRIVPPTVAICSGAARLRAEHPALRLPDAIHLATAVAESATAFLTNDKRLPAVPGLDIVLLSQL